MGAAASHLHLQLHLPRSHGNEAEHGPGYDLIIVGGGNAAGYMARGLAQRNTSSHHKVAIFTEEDALPYERPALSKGFLMDDSVRPPAFNTCVAAKDGGPTECQDEAWYAMHEIDVKRNTAVESINADEKTITTAAGEVFWYHKLVVCTGMEPYRPRVPGTGLAGDSDTELQGIHYMRSLHDAEAIVEDMNRVKEQGGHVVVVGGGYIGMEVAAGIASNGVDVTMVFRDKHFMPRFFPTALAEHYERFFESKGIQLRRGAGAIGFDPVSEGDTRVGRVRLTQGDPVECSMVVVGCGSRPRIELLERIGCHITAAGIMVDENMQTGRPDIYAIGDIATFTLPSTHQLSRFEHVDHARRSADYLVRVLAGEEHGPYDYVPHFYSRVFDKHWIFYGVAYRDFVCIGNLDPQLLGLWYEQEGHIIGMFLESGSEDEQQLVQRVARTSPQLHWLMEGDEVESEPDYHTIAEYAQRPVSEWLEQLRTAVEAAEAKQQTLVDASATEDEEKKDEAA